MSDSRFVDFPKSLDALYDVNLWDVPVDVLRAWASRLEGVGATRESRTHLTRVRRNLSLRMAREDGVS